MAKAKKEIVVEAAGREVVITNPDKVYFPDKGYTKLDLAKYYLAVAEGVLRGVANRPMALKRYVNGAAEEAFYQKRAPENRPEWIDTVEIHFPSGRSAHEIVLRNAAQLLWIVNLGCIDLHPHPVRADNLEHPDELRVDLDPTPGVPFEDVRKVALVVRDVLIEHQLIGWPKTSGSRGMHINVRISPQRSFGEVRQAALALAREVERRMPGVATSKWWKEERQGVFVDYNQNAKDRTTVSAWSVRPTPDGRVSMPLSWDDVTDCDPAAFTLASAPGRFAELGDAAAGIDGAIGSLDLLLALAGEQKAAGLGDAPWPPMYEKQKGEPKRVMPSAAAGRRQPKHPLATVAKAAHKEDALEGLERWKARHPDVASLLKIEDVLVDSMRGRSSTWTRVRINLRNAPGDQVSRLLKEPPDPDYEPFGDAKTPRKRTSTGTTKRTAKKTGQRRDPKTRSSSKGGVTSS